MSIERLRLANNGLIEVHSEGQMCWHDDYEKLASQKNEWISVKDELPKKYEDVIVWPYPTEYYMKAEYFGHSASGRPVWKYGEYQSGWGHEAIELTRPVTHWRPLPQPPQEVLEQPQEY